MSHPTATRTRQPVRAPLGRLLLAQIKAEALSSMRVPEYVVGVVGVPIILYTMFGLPNADDLTQDGTSVGALMLASMTSYGIVSLAIFTFGADVATERGKGWLRRLRATPMPMGAYFLAKVVAAMVFALAIVAGTVAVAVGFGGIRFAWADLAQLVGWLLVGTVAFAPFGFAIAYWFPPRAANGIANLIFLPLAFVSGFFFPRAQLPDVLAELSPYLPTYHFGQLIWRTMGSDADITLFVDGSPDSVATNLTWVAGAFVVCCVLTVIGYRRDLHRDGTA